MNAVWRFVMLLAFSTGPASAQSTGTGEPTVPNTIVMEKPTLTIELLNIEDNVVSDSSFNTLKPGQKFIALKFRFKNTGTAKVDASSLYLRLKNNEDEEFSGQMFDVKEPSFNSSGGIEPNDASTGWVSFKVTVETAIDSLRIRYATFSEASPYVKVDINNLKDRKNKK